MVTDPDLARLASTFTYTDARRAGISDRRLAALGEEGRIDQIGRGLYRRLDTAAADADPHLLEISRRAPEATLCLATALAQGSRWVRQSPSMNTNGLPNIPCSE
jgi:hypothetical protein